MMRLQISRLVVLCLCVVGLISATANAMASTTASMTASATAGASGSGPVRDADVFFDSFERGAVAADHVMASSAGAQMLALGGNAVDAAVAASFTLSVVRPYSCGLGGGGFMVIYLPDDPTHGFVQTAINYRETSAYDASAYGRGVSMSKGPMSVAVPGTVAGLLYALEKYGTLDRATVMGPAIAAAHGGFVVDEHYMGAAGRLIEEYVKNPGLQDSEMGMPWESFALWGRVKIGDRLKNPDQGRALELIAQDGIEAFTTGEIGRAIVSALTPAKLGKKQPSPMSISDLSGYRPVEVAPVSVWIGDKVLIGMPPPSSGGVTMFQTLKIMEAKGFDFADPSMPIVRVVQMIESLKHAFADRSRYLADSSFVFVPVDALLEPGNIYRMSKPVYREHHEPEFYGTHGLLDGDGSGGGVVPDDGGTSHVSVIDPFGGAVAMTETINHEFGSKIGVEGFGFMLNNEMDDFTSPKKNQNGFGLVQSDRNLPEVGKRPLSSMSPTIVLDEDGAVFAIAGASGGPKIITGTMQVLMGVMAGLDAGEAVARPRLHHQWLPYETLVEEGFDVRILDVLNDGIRGYGQVVRKERAVIGNVQVIVRGVDEEGRFVGWQAASDPRKGGRPSGLD